MSDRDSSGGVGDGIGSSVCNEPWSLNSNRTSPLQIKKKNEAIIKSLIKAPIKGRKLPTAIALFT